MSNFHLLLLTGLLPAMLSLGTAAEFRSGAAAGDITPTNLPIRTAGNLTLTAQKRKHSQEGKRESGGQRASGNFHEALISPGQPSVNRAHPDRVK